MGIIVNKVIDIPGQMICLELILKDVSYKIMNIYAPNNSNACCEFFQECSKYFSDSMVLLGDFNIITSSDDHLSGNLDATSGFVDGLLRASHFHEI